MIYEYALDPEFIIKLLDQTNLCNTLPRYFGLGTPCIIAGYPEKLYAKCKELIDNELDKADSRRKAKLEQKLSKLTQLIKDLSQNCTKRYNCVPWEHDFNAENKTLAFRGILTNSDDTNANHIGIDKLHDRECEIYTHNHGELVKRNEDDLCKVLLPILRNAAKFTFIDPYFFPNDRFTKIYKKYLSAIAEVNKKRVKGIREITIICDKKVIIPDSEFKRSCEAQLVPILPPSIKLNIYGIKEKENKDGEELHNRYILTDIGGVLLGHGTDISNKKPNAYDDIMILARNQYSHWNMVYKPNSEYFTWPIEPITISTIQSS